MFLKVSLFISALMVFSIHVFAISDDYPKTLQERKADEMGSLAGSEGVVFKPKKIKNESTKATIGTHGLANKYLWHASIDTLDFAPLSIADSTGGVITTEWYSPKGKPQYSYKIQVSIKNDVISLESIDVKVFEKVLKNGQWIQNDKPSNLAIILQDKIILKAREQYIKEKRKD